ncbi:MAG: DUF1259 domain-containing protein, partial [Gemmatimonadetes bacterium]|nr:DUF1259 domain-containing protein [Gemmatimonadota bacterium]
LAATPPDAYAQPSIDCERIAALLDRPAPADGATCRVTFPRGDLSVRLLGAELPAGMGLTAWAAFHPAGSKGAIVMGDLALTSEELGPVTAGLRENGLAITAIHRHMLGESPAMSFVHYLGIGPPDSLAGRLRAALDRAGRPFGGPASPTGGEPGVVAGVDCDAIADALGADPAGADRGPGYCKVSLPRDDLSVTVDGIPVPASMGISSWFAFRQTADGEAAVIAGDMALLEDGVNPAVAALREAGIEVVALHNHMLFDEPTVYFFHFQARGAPLELARGLRAGLEAAGIAP